MATKKAKKQTVKKVSPTKLIEAAEKLTHAPEQLQEFQLHGNGNGHIKHDNGLTALRGGASFPFHTPMASFVDESSVSREDFSRILRTEKSKSLITGMYYGAAIACCVFLIKMAFMERNGSTKTVRIFEEI